MMSSGGPRDQEKIAALMEKDGMSLLGPPLCEGAPGEGVERSR